MPGRGRGRRPPSRCPSPDRSRLARGPADWSGIGPPVLCGGRILLSWELSVSSPCPGALAIQATQGLEEPGRADGLVDDEPDDLLGALAAWVGLPPRLGGRTYGRCDGTVTGCGGAVTETFAVPGPPLFCPTSLRERLSPAPLGATECSAAPPLPFL